MSTENQSGVQYAVELLNKLYLARTDGMTHIQRLIPYLQYREAAANRYFQSDVDEATKNEFVEIVMNCNKQIIAILGL